MAREIVSFPSKMWWFSKVFSTFTIAYVNGEWASVAARKPLIVAMNYDILTYIHAYIHTYLPTYLPTYIHTYIHIYIYIYIPSWWGCQPGLPELLPQRLRRHGRLRALRSAQHGAAPGGGAQRGAAGRSHGAGACQRSGWGPWDVDIWGPGAKQGRIHGKTIGKPWENGGLMGKP